MTAAFHPSVWIVSDLTGHDASDPVGVTAKRRTLLEDSIRSALRRLTAGDAQVVIVAPVSTGQPVECAIKKPPPGYCRRRVFTSRYPLTRFMDLLERQAIRSFDRRVAYIRIDDILCPGGICPAVIDGHLARFDGTHFTGRFSRKIVPIIVERAKSAGVEFDRRDDSP